MYCVEFEDVAKGYGDVAAVGGVDLRLGAERTTALIGESGCGKSTLLQLVNGLLMPDRGRLRLFGEPLDYSNLETLRRGMGYAVQGAALFPHLTVFDNVTLAARVAGWPVGRRQERFAALMDLLGLEAAFGSRFPHELSGGQQQRVSLCRAMMLNPPLLLLDEPFSALDPMTRGAIQQEFVKIRQAEARSVILVTHDMHEASLMADDVVVLQAGRVVQQGSVEEVLAAPANDYVVGLLQAVERS